MKNQIFNPYLPPYEYIPDAEPYVFGDRVYIYGSHEEAGGTKFCTKDYAIWSAPIEDLSDWRFGGISYKKTEDPHNKEGYYNLFAPDVVKGMDGKYYLYYCLSFRSEFGVAVSEEPKGPFRFYGHVKNGDGTSFDQSFPYDPSVLVDEDGSVYLYYGFDPSFTLPAFEGRTTSNGCVVVQLAEDMLTVISEPKICIPGRELSQGTSFIKGQEYFEAPSVRKIENKYYMIYCNQNKSELCYAISDFPDRGFEYQGVIVSNGDIGYKGNQNPVYYTGNIHGGLVKIKEDWYIFYHRHTHGMVTSRQGCAEKVIIDQNGRIEQVPITSCGLNGKALSGIGYYPAYIACHLEDKNGMLPVLFGQNIQEQIPYIVEEKESESVIHYINNIKNQVKWGYRYFDFKEDAVIKITVRGSAKGYINIYDSVQETNRIAQIDLSLDNKNWTTLKEKMNNKAGESGLYFVFEGTGKMDFISFCLEEVL